MRLVTKAALALVRGLVWAAGNAAAISVFLLTLVVVYGVVLRYVFHSPVKWTLEYSVYLLVLCVFLGLGHTLRENAHIRVDVVTQYLPERVRLYLRVATSFLSLGYLVLLTWQTWALAQRSLLRGAIYPYSVTGMPAFVPQLLMPLGIALLGLQMIVDIVRDSRALRRKSSPQGS